MSSSFVCVQCGDMFRLYDDLELHWQVESHGPSSTQQAQLNKARESIRPVEIAAIQRRRGVTRINRHR